MTLFETQGEARRFFIEKVVQQAELENAPLSHAEQQMLDWSETDPEPSITAEQANALVDELESQISDDQYESKISGLLARSYRRDAASDRATKAAWRAAYARLSEGDHYIAIMIDQALGSALRRKWFF